MSDADTFGPEDVASPARRLSVDGVLLSKFGVMESPLLVEEESTGFTG